MSAIFLRKSVLLFPDTVINYTQHSEKYLIMKNTDLSATDQYNDILSEESSTQLIIRPYHIIGTAMLLVAWAWLGTVIIS